MRRQKDSRSVVKRKKKLMDRPTENNEVLSAENMMKVTVLLDKLTDTRVDACCGRNMRLFEAT